MIFVKQVAKNIDWDLNPAGTWLRAEFEIISKNECDKVIALGLDNNTELIFIYMYNIVRKDEIFSELEWCRGLNHDSIDEILSIHPDFAQRLIKNIDVLNTITTKHGARIFCLNKDDFISGVLPEFPSEFF